MRGRLALIVAAMLPLAGCLEDGAADCPEVPDPSLRYLMTGGAYLDTDPAQPWDTVVLVGDNGSAALDTLHLAASGGHRPLLEPISANATDLFGKVSFQPDGADPVVRVLWDASSQSPDCRAEVSGKLWWELGEPALGDSATAGQGLHVYTAGFWENGTLFYTNIEEVHAQDWPRAGWYSWEGGDPLPVYVYGQDRSEQPAYWKAPSGQVPPTGSPADPHVQDTLGQVESAAGLGYFTTIEGFNEALKGLSTSTTRVVRLAPEEAYTLPGYEGHDLYGDPIVFYIKVVDVVDVPCPAGWATDPCAPMAASGQEPGPAWA